MTVERRMLMAAAGNTEPTWVLNTLAAGVATSRATHICANPTTNGFMIVGYNTLGASGSYQFKPWYSISTDGGYTFSAPAYMNATANNIGSGPIACDATGRYTMVCNTSDASGINTGLVYMTSTNGTTWTGPVTISTNAFYNPSDVQIDPSGRWVLVLTDSSGGSTNIIGRHSTSTNGTTWSAPALYNGSTAKFWGVSLAYNSTLTRWVSVGFDQDTFAGQFSTSTNGTTWTTPASISTTFNSTRGVAASPLAGIFVATGYNSAGIGATHSLWSRSTNGTTWANASLYNGSTGGDILMSDIECSPTTGTFIAFGQDNSSGVSQAYNAISTDGGNTWTSPTPYLVGSSWEPSEGVFNGVGRLVQIGRGPVSTTTYWAGINGL